MSNVMNMNALTEEASRYQSKYGEELTLLAESYDKKYGSNKKWSESFDAVAFGKYAETFENFLPVLESDQTTRDSLGQVLNQGLDLVLAQYSALPMQFLASIQPLDQEVGVAYFRRAVATQDRAGVTAGTELMGEWGAQNTQIGDYASEVCVSDSLSINAATTGQQTVNVPFPVAKRSLKLVVAGKINAIDDGEGHIFGLGINSDKSSINYETGVVTVEFSDIPSLGLTGPTPVVVTTTQLLPSSTNIPSFKWDLVSKPIQVQYWMLQSSYSTISDFVVRKKFGTALGEELVKDTVNQVSGAVLYQAIQKLRKAAIINETLNPIVAAGLGGLTWSQTAPAGVSVIDHRRTFDDCIEDAVRRMELIAGKGGASFLIVGSAGRKVLRSLGVQDAGAIAGPHLMGFYGSVPVFYAPNWILPADEVIVGYRGDMWFEAPLVYAPFLPITTVKVEGNTNNTFVNTVGTAHGAGLDIVAGGFIQRIKLV